MKKIIGLVAFGLMLTSVQAKEKSLHDQFTGQGYGAAGCGLGSVLFGAKPGIVQVFVSTTNGTFGSQTFGISSGTSNCENSKSVAQAAEAFIADNSKAVEKDVARGNGETLDTLASLMSCANNSAFNSKLQTHYNQFFKAGATAQASARSIVTYVRNDSELSTSCSL